VHPLILNIFSTSTNFPFFFFFFFFFLLFLQAGIKGSAVCLHPGAVQTDLARYITNGQDGGDVRLSEVTPISEPKPWEKFLKGALDKVILPIDIGANTQVKRVRHLTCESFFFSP
jgi:hypothetical protein